MKYMEKGGFQNNPLMKLTLGFTLLFMVGLWMTNFFFYFSKMGLTPHSVVQYYLGSAANFTPPRSTQSMLEITHFHLPIMGVVILLLTHLVIFAPFKNSIKVGIIAASFLSAFIGEMSSWLVRFVSPHFAILKIFCFLTFQFTLGGLIVILGLFLAFPPHSSKLKKSHH